MKQAEAEERIQREFREKLGGVEGIEGATIEILGGGSGAASSFFGGGKLPGGGSMKIQGFEVRSATTDDE